MRPLLEQSKSALAAYANAMRVPFREDASNARLDIQRNHIRHKLLPVLRKHQPALERVILRQMEMLAADAEFVTQAAKDWMDVAEKGALRRPCRRAKRQATEQQGPGFPSAYSHPHHLFQSVGKPPHPNPLPQGGRGGRRRASSATDLKTSSPAFDNLPVAVQRRCLQLQLARAGIAVEFALVEHLRVSPHRPISVPAGKHGTEHATRNTVSIVRDESGLLQICKLIKAAFVDSRQNARLEGAAGQITQGKVRITWKKMLMSTGIFRAPKAVENCEIFDAATVGSDIVVRYWLPGDRFQPIGMKKPVKLQDLFTNAKIPREKRRQLLVGVTASGEIFWVEGLRIAERFKLDKKSVYGLKWAWERVE